MSLEKDLETRETENVRIPSMNARIDKMRGIPMTCSTEYEVEYLDSEP